MAHLEGSKLKRFGMWLCVPAVFAITGCDSPVIREAKEAESEGRVINNEAMRAMYPASFRPGSPQYLERDFEAGAEFICDEIKVKYKRDICSEERMNWRR